VVAVEVTDAELRVEVLRVDETEEVVEMVDEVEDELDEVEVDDTVDDKVDELLPWHDPTTEGTAPGPLPIATKFGGHLEPLSLTEFAKCSSRLSQSNTTYAARRKFAPRTGISIPQSARTLTTSNQDTHQTSMRPSSTPQAASRRNPQGIR
jgi:hypothetical protein